MSSKSVEDALQNLVKSPNNQCFACGPNNPHGLHLHFQREDGVVRTTFRPEVWHEGWEGVVHGGILSTLLDEAMAYAVYYQGVKGVTARMEVRFRLPVQQGERLLVEAQVVSETARLADIKGRITRDGQVVAEAAARFMKMGRLDARS